MPIKNVTNTSPEELVQIAYSTFKKKGFLFIHVNRRFTHIKLSDLCKPNSKEGKIHFLLRNNLLDACVMFASKKIEDMAPLYFYSLEGEICCFNKKVFKDFTKILNDNFDDVELILQRALVEKITQTELILIDSDHDPSIEFDQETCPVESKVTTWIFCSFPDPEEEKSGKNAKLTGNMENKA